MLLDRSYHKKVASKIRLLQGWNEVTLVLPLPELLCEVVVDGYIWRQGAEVICEKLVIVVVRKGIETYLSINTSIIEGILKCRVLQKKYNYE